MAHLWGPAPVAIPEWLQPAKLQRGELIWRLWRGLSAWVLGFFSVWIPRWMRLPALQEDGAAQ